MIPTTPGLAFREANKMKGAHMVRPIAGVLVAFLMVGCLDSNGNIEGQGVEKKTGALTRCVAYAPDLLGSGAWDVAPPADSSLANFDFGILICTGANYTGQCQMVVGGSTPSGGNINSYDLLTQYYWAGAFGGTTGAYIRSFKLGRKMSANFYRLQGFQSLFLTKGTGGCIPSMPEGLINSFSVFQSVP